MSNLQWTTAPSGDGWYWVKPNDSNEIEIVKIHGDSVMGTFYDAWMDIHSYTYWYGPLEIPELVAV